MKPLASFGCRRITEPSWIVIMMVSMMMMVSILIDNGINYDSVLW